MDQIKAGDWVKVADFDHNMSFNKNLNVNMTDIEGGIFKVISINSYNEFHCPYTRNDTTIVLCFYPDEIKKVGLSDLWINFVNKRYIAWNV